MKRKMKPGDLCIVTETVWGILNDVNDARHVHRFDATTIVIYMSHVEERVQRVYGNSLHASTALVDVMCVALLTSKGIVKVRCNNLRWLEQVAAGIENET